MIRAERKQRCRRCIQKIKHTNKGKDILKQSGVIFHLSKWKVGFLNFILITVLAKQ